MKPVHLSLNLRFVLFAFIATASVCVSSSKTILKVGLTDGTAKTYALDDDAVVKFENAEMIFSNRDWQFSIPLCELSDWRYSTETSGIGDIPDDGGFSCVCEEGRFIISGLNDGDAYSVYAVDGKTMAAARVKGSELTLDASSWPSGVYVIVSGTHNIKTVKR